MNKTTEELRDYFAAAASDTDIHDMKCSLTTRITRQEARYRCADAMLAARQAEAVPAAGMSDELFRALLDLWMGFDRTEEGQYEVVFTTIVAESKRRGFDDYGDAFRRFKLEATQ